MTPVEGTVSALGSVGPTATPVGGTVSARGSVGPTVTPVGGAVSEGSSNVHSDSDSVSDSESVGTIPIARSMALF